MDRFDRYSKTLYFEVRMRAISHIIRLEGRMLRIAQKTLIFNVTSTLVFLTVGLSVGDIFSQEYSTYIRIRYKKNYRNWTSGYTEIIT